MAVHALGDGAHDFDGAGSAGHDAGAQAGEIEPVEIRMDEFGDEHGGHAVERRGALRWTASSVASASNCAEGRMRAAPVTTDTMEPITDPKQW